MEIFFLLMLIVIFEIRQFSVPWRKIYFEVNENEVEMCKRQIYCKRAHDLSFLCFLVSQLQLRR